VISEYLCITFETGLTKKSVTFKGRMAFTNGTEEPSVEQIQKHTVEINGNI
jgi:hypothetical protein